jgi:hypothetical protein
MTSPGMRPFFQAVRKLLMGSPLLSLRALKPFTRWSIRRIETHGDGSFYPSEFELCSGLLWRWKVCRERQLRGNGDFLLGYDAVFKTGAINRSATPPDQAHIRDRKFITPLLHYSK